MQVVVIENSCVFVERKRDTVWEKGNEKEYKWIFWSFFRSEFSSCSWHTHYQRSSQLSCSLDYFSLFFNCDHIVCRQFSFENSPINNPTESSLKCFNGLSSFCFLHQFVRFQQCDENQNDEKKNNVKTREKNFASEWKFNIEFQSIVNNVAKAILSRSYSPKLNFRWGRFHMKNWRKWFCFFPFFLTVFLFLTHFSLLFML